jgi:hypothetical protein
MMIDNLITEYAEWRQLGNARERVQTTIQRKALSYGLDQNALADLQKRMAEWEKTAILHPPAESTLNRPLFRLTDGTVAPLFANAAHTFNGNLTLRVRDSLTRPTLNFSGIEAYLIGRQMGKSVEQPYLNLESVSVKEHGISRLHALMYVDKGTLHIVDLESRNHTIVNGVALQPHQPTPLHHGDDVWFGLLQTGIDFS